MRITLENAQHTARCFCPDPRRFLVQQALSSELLTRPATELAALVRRGEVSAEEVVAAHVERITIVNPTINAVVANRFDAARTEARAVDAKRRARETLPPFAGVPFTVKEMINLAGMPSTFGCTTRRHRRADRDATIVHRLRAAGAIPIASTNVPEWGMWYETNNLVYGRTNNPYNVKHTTGGSSGGEAAIVASGGAAFGVGSDIGGSLRLPAAFCGVFAHKPTGGLLPLTGHYPVYASGPDADIAKRNPWVVLGPLTRSARDLLPIIRICAGDDGIDPNIEAVELGDEAVDWGGRPVYVIEEPRIAWAGAAQPEMRSAVRDAARIFEDLGARMEEGPVELLREMVELWFAALQSLGDRPVTELLAVTGSISLTREFGALALRRPRFTLPILCFALFEKLIPRSRARMIRMLARIEQIQRDFEHRIGDGILLLPPHPRPAPKHGRALLHPFAFAYTAAFNVLRVPATVAPVASTADGLPVGVQIVTKRGNDHLSIAAAAQIERAYRTTAIALTSTSTP